MSQMKIGVLIKHVPDTNTRIQLKDGKIDETAIKYVMNPYDEFAVEEAVKTKEKLSSQGVQVEIVGVCLGPKEASKSLRDAFAVGVDRGILILDNERKAADPLAVSSALAQICRDENFSLILAGKQAVDSDSHAVAQMLAARLKMPYISVVSKVEILAADKLKVERDIEGGVKEVYEMKLPALLTANKGLNKMRLASLPNIRKASQKELKEVALPEVKTGYRVTAWSLPAERGAVKIIEGTSAEQAQKLVQALREEAKVI